MRVRPACPLFLSLVLASLLAAAPAPAGGPGCGALWRRARALDLPSDPAWHTLLHYRRGWLAARSLMDDPSFFLSPRGARSPAAEMEAELRALCAATPGPADNGDPRCRFPARYAWLSERLGIDPALVSPDACPDLADALEQMAPAGVTLVFPAAHPNSPASMFGHTLIRIDPAGGPALLAYSVNYAAQTDPDDSAAVYAFKGLVGMYRGYYTLLPYYEKVLQYSDIEQRDVWEYRLNLTPAEARRLALHAWELKDRYADYYYFDENCSYNILFLLEAARAGVHLTDRYPAWVAPLDTVEDVIGQGLVASVGYRPSMVRRLRVLARGMGEPEIRTARDIARGSLPPSAAATLGPGSEARVLDAAAELVRIAFVRGEMDKAAYQRRFLAVLAARSRLGPPPHSGPAVDRPPAPHTGHSSSRVALSAGRAWGEPFVGVRFRPAYHGLEDPDQGYVPGSRINFADVDVGYGLDEGRPYLESADLIRITSLSPWGVFFRPRSWAVRLGAESRPAREGGRVLVGLAGGGAGAAWAPWEGCLSYALARAELVVSRRLPAGAGVGVGPSAGAIVRLGERWKGGLQAQALGYPVGPARPGWRLDLWATVRLARNHALTLGLTRRGWDGAAGTRARLAWNAYF